MSDHLPVALDVKLNSNVPLLNNHENESVKELNNKSLRWDHADLSQYYTKSYTLLEPLLDSIDPLYCELMDYAIPSVTVPPIYNCTYNSQESKSQAILLINNIYNGVVSNF